MFHVVGTVRQWQREGRPVTVGRMVAGHGLAGRDAAPVAVWTPGLPAVGSPVAARAAGADPGITSVTLSDASAAGDGLSCGGTAQILVQPATDLPASVWEAFAAGEPVGLLDPVVADDVVAGSTTVFTASSVPPTHARFFGRGVSAFTRVDDALLTTYWPTTRLLVVGDGAVADALVAQAGLLGWTAQVEPDREPALAALADYGRADAVVVLSHDRDVDGPVLAAAVAGAAGYVGAMGSRGTQAARRDWFAAHGVTGTERVHGPAGFAIGGFGPAEIALSITAEIVSVRSGVSPVG